MTKVSFLKFFLCPCFNRMFHLPGLEHTNIEGDLKVEHTNCQFKAGLMQLCGNYSEESLQRIAKSLDVSSSLQEKLTPQYVNRFWGIFDNTL